MSSLNKVLLIGNLGKDPDIKISNNIKIAKISVATSMKRQDGTEDTEWHYCTLFEKLADVAENYLKKGNKVCVEGRIKSTRYTDDMGIERTRYEIIVSNLVMLGNKGDSQQSVGNPPPLSQGYNPYAQQKPSTGFGQNKGAGFNAVQAANPFNQKRNIPQDDVPF